jgi:hypothetical protein
MSRSRVWCSGPCGIGFCVAKTRSRDVPAGGRRPCARRKRNLKSSL